MKLSGFLHVTYLAMPDTKKTCCKKCYHEDEDKLTWACFNGGCTCHSPNTTMEERFDEFFWNEDYEGSALEIKAFIKAEIALDREKRGRELQEKINKLSMPIGSEGAEKQAYDYALSDVLALLKDSTNPNPDSV